MYAIKQFIPLSIESENRASGISLFARMSNALFGSPRIARANGVDDSKALVRAYRNASAAISKKKVSVFEIDRAGIRGNERLPRIWLSEAETDLNSNIVRGRRYTESYPKGIDKGGQIAFDMGERCFSEGIASEDGTIQKEYFRAAEILFLHAVERGSVAALSKLGVIYRYDMCEGNYWKDVVSAHAKHSHIQVETKAYRAFARAAARGNAEAKWNLGDLTKEGVGCHANKPLAFNLYCGSFRKAVGCLQEEVAMFSHAAVSTLIAMRNIPSIEDASCSAVRIAECYEFGLGCTLDLESALNWYSIAESFADMSVRDGHWYYKKELAQAECGIGRVLKKAS